MSALRSGNYTKCNGALHRNDSFCPLGVLCDLSKLDKWVDDPYSNKKSYLGQVNYLPLKVREWAGMSHQEYNAVSSYVMVLNDDIKINFMEMADFLEKKYKKQN